MSVYRVTDIIGTSSKSWEDAAQVAASRAAKTLKGVRSLWVQDMSATVDAKGKINGYRVTCKVSFEVKDSM